MASLNSPGPFGGTIAHGFLTLAFLTSMMSEILEIGGASHFVNYGLDRVRFTGVVRAGDRVRLRQTLANVSPVKGGMIQQILLELGHQTMGSLRPDQYAEFKAKVEAL